MSRRTGRAELLVLSLLVGIVQCKRAPEKAADITPPTSDTAQDRSKSRVPTDSLENTYWKLTHLRDAPVPAAPGQREPHLIFNAENRRVNGSGGCNHVGGSYELNGDRLSLDSITTTLMACAEGMETEKSFLETLREVSGWRVDGQQLELVDDSGKTLALFEARQK
jgi:heat shock protein HslJ